MTRWKQTIACVHVKGPCENEPSCNENKQFFKLHCYFLLSAVRKKIIQLCWINWFLFFVSFILNYEIPLFYLLHAVWLKSSLASLKIQRKSTRMLPQSSEKVMTKWTCSHEQEKNKKFQTMIAVALPSLFFFLVAIVTKHGDVI